MQTRRAVLLTAAAALAAGPALAQFPGPSEQSAAATVAQARAAPIGTYMTLEGYVTVHLGEDYYRFTDGTDEIRVEIPYGAFAGRPVGPETRVRLRVEVDRGLGGRYLWVEALEVL